MTRATAVPLSLSGFLAVIVFAALMTAIGLLSDDAMRLWAGAINASDGIVPIGRIMSSYPSIPFLASAGLQFISPDGLPAPSLLAAGLVGLVVGIFFLELRGTGLSLCQAALATSLLAFHPALLRAGINGAADMFLAAFLFLFGSALFDLRARAAAPEVMAAGFSLLGIAFSHPMGAAIAFAASPFLIFAVPPSVIANSAINVVLVLIFPTIFCAGAFTYVSWVFPGSGWSFFAAPSESIATWASGFAQLFGGSITGSLAADAALTICVSIVIGAPVTLYGLALARSRRPLIVPAIVLAAIAVTAAALTVATGFFGNPAAVNAVVPVLAILVVIRIADVRKHRGKMFALLIAGWIGGFAGSILADPGAALQFGGIQQAARTHERADAFRLGQELKGLDGVLIDTDHAPMVVIGRGSARGLIAPTDDVFSLAVLMGRISAPYVAVPDPHSSASVQDHLNKAFPLLHRNGAQGYRLIYQNRTWRLFARVSREGQ
jgi:hypothetical protein